jgi:hypothetical protein
MWTQINDLKEYKSEATSLEDLIHLDATATALVASYTAHNVAIPDWLTKAQARLKADIKARNRDSLEKRLSEVRARRAALATTEEKRKNAEDEEAAIVALLGA